MMRMSTSNGTVPAPGARRRHFASGAQVRLDLDGGEGVSVRAALTYGQRQRLATAGLAQTVEATGGGSRVPMDWAAYYIERLATWLLDWSLRDEDGDPVLVSREAIDALHPDMAAEINAALDAYIDAEEAKKAPAAAGTSRRATPSPSASASAGPGPSRWRPPPASVPPRPP